MAEERSMTTTVEMAMEAIGVVAAIRQREYTTIWTKYRVEGGDGWRCR
jgi:hypothetical protein